MTISVGFGTEYHSTERTRAEGEALKKKSLSFQPGLRGARAGYFAIDTDRPRPVTWFLLRGPDALSDALDAIQSELL